MKQAINKSKVYIEQADLDELLTEVKETVAVKPTPSADSKIFSAAELWNIQRMKKNIRIRSTFWN